MSEIFVAWSQAEQLMMIDIFSGEGEGHSMISNYITIRSRWACDLCLLSGFVDQLQLKDFVVLD